MYICTTLVLYPDRTLAERHNTPLDLIQIFDKLKDSLEEMSINVTNKIIMEGLVREEEIFVRVLMCIL